MNTSPALPAALLPLAAAAALVFSAAPAHAASAVADVEARLLGNGAAVQVQVQYSCEKDEQSAISVAVSQKIDRDAAVGRYFPSFLVPCTGETQTLDATVLPNDLAFREGLAVVSVTMDICSPTAGACYAGTPLTEVVELED
jgi:hypothetical protein